MAYMIHFNSISETEGYAPADIGWLKLDGCDDGFPDAVCSFTRLKRLEITNSGVTELPGWITELQELEVLDLSGNNISVVKLSKLKKLKLNRNRITSLPSGIGQMRNLAELSLLGNRLEYLSPDIAGLHELVILDLSANPLKTLPETIGMFKRLERLVLNNCNLQKLPVVIAEIESLKFLECRDNPEMGQIPAPLREKNGLHITA